MKRLIISLAVGCLLIAGCKKNAAASLLSDIQQNLAWTLGNQASVGTAVALTDGTLRYTQLAGINEYRFLSTWYGVSEQKDVSGNSFNVQDCFKLGLNVGYFFSGFKNQPPSLISNLVIGPGVSTSLFSQFGTRQPLTPIFDVNYRFGGS